MRLIDADALREQMFNYYDCVNEGTFKGGYSGQTLMDYEVADLIRDCIDDTPTADVIEVVRRVECKHRIDDERKYVESAKLENIISDGLNSGKFGHDAVEILSEIYALESADVAPVVHGKWEECDWVEYDGHGECVHYPGKGLRCSRCCNVFKKELLWKANFCPNCGAKMDLEE